MADCYLREDLKGALSEGEPGADQLLSWGAALANNALDKDVYRNKEGRKTLRFEWQGRSYFLKQHSGIGWGEIFKNLSQGRLPVLGASNEFRAVNALTRIGVDTMTVAAYASKGANPATVQSMIVTDDLVGTVSLEDYCAQWSQNPPPFTVRLRILLKLADSSRRMHQAGINHRDFYICHFHLDEATLSSRELRCCLIDLHRAQMRSNTPRRWLIKDLAGLYFSAMDCGLTQRDLLRFMRHYSDDGLRQALGRDSKLWLDVSARASKLYRQQHGRDPSPMLNSDDQQPQLTFVQQMITELENGDKEIESRFRESVEILKPGPHSYAGVRRNSFGDGTVFVKCYLPKGPISRCFGQFGLSRAERAYRLTGMIPSDLPANSPLGFVRNKRSGRTYIFSSFIVGQNLSELHKGSQLTGDLLHRVMRMAGEQLARFHMAGWQHGDFKWGNIIFVPSSEEVAEHLCFIDLDGVSRVKSIPSAARDLARFIVNAEDYQLDESAIRKFVDGYASVSRRPARAILRDCRAPLEKLRRRHDRKYGLRKVAMFEEEMR